jgi:two-component system response regulator FixJ
MLDPQPTVFVIDDDASMRRALSYLFQSAGYKVETHSSAEEFLRREHYDGVGCIILDVRMPGLNGMDLQERLMRSDDTGCPLSFSRATASFPWASKP